MAMQQQTVVLQQPMAGSGVQPQNIREWSSGLCGCFEDFGSCCYAYFFYPCFQCTLASQMDETCCVPICFGRVGMVAMRTKLRSMAGIRGSICMDFICMNFCEFCSATQMARELKHVGM